MANNNDGEEWGRNQGLILPPNTGGFQTPFLGVNPMGFMSYQPPFQIIEMMMEYAKNQRYPVGAPSFLKDMAPFIPKCPSFEELARVYNSGPDRYEILKKAAQDLMQAEIRLRSTRKPIIFSRFSDKWQAVNGTYDAMINNVRAMAGQLGIPIDVTEGREGIGGAVLAHIANKEQDQRMIPMEMWQKQYMVAMQYALEVLAVTRQVYTQMYTNPAFLEAITRYAQEGSRHQPTPRVLEQARQDILPAYMPQIARGVHEKRPIIIKPPVIRRPMLEGPQAQRKLLR